MQVRDGIKETAGTAAEAIGSAGTLAAWAKIQRMTGNISAVGVGGATIRVIPIVNRQGVVLIETGDEELTVDIDGPIDLGNIYIRTPSSGDGVHFMYGEIG